MLVCPQCQHKNLDISKFCSRCGTPLQNSASDTLTPTPEADQANGDTFPWSIDQLDPLKATVPPTVISAYQDKQEETSPRDNASLINKYSGDDDVTLIPEHDSQIRSGTSNLTTPASPDVGPVTTAWTVVLYPCEANSPWLSCPERGDIMQQLEQETAQKGAITYLDAQKRYRCLTSFTHGISTGRVVDETPQAPTRVSTLHQVLATEAEVLDLGDAASVIAKLQALPSQPPPVMISYLSLRLAQSDFIPRLHDAWVDYVTGQLDSEPQQILLLEDRTELPSLWQAWQDEQIDHGQLLAWMEEMTDLWPLLQAWGCAASLLDDSNLCVLPDNVLALRQLSFTPVAEPGHIALVKLWKQLFAAAAPPRQQAFSPLWIALQAKDVQDLSDLQQLLQQLWETLQSDLLPLEEDETEVGDFPTLLDSHWQTNLSQLEALGIIEDAPTAVLPKQLVQLEAFGLTDTGRQRHHNEDFFLIENHQHYCGTSIGQKLQARGVYVLCDGMGGHAQGEVASSLAAKTLFHYFQNHWPLGEPLPEDEVIREGIFAANQAIYDINENQQTSGSSRMGTTLVLALADNQQFCLAHVGDSRLYRYTRRQGLEQLTVDHEVGQRDIKRGVEPEIAYARPDAYQLTQALGPRGREFLSPDILTVDVSDDSLFLLCSDGLTDNHCLEAHVESHIAPMLGFDLPLAKGVRSLISLGNEHNGHDNLTVVAIRMKLRSELDSIF